MNRRELLLGIGGASAGLTGLPALAAGGLDLADRDDLLTAVVKMRGSLDDRLCIGWVIGARYAVVEHRAIPMMGLMAATFTQYRRIRDDAFEAKSLEVAYFTDLENRQLLESWRNPVTGALVDVPMTRMGPSRFVLTADGLDLQVPAGEARGLELNHRFDVPVVRGDDVWITEVIDAGSEPRPGRKPFVYNEMSTYHAQHVRARRSGAGDGRDERLFSRFGDLSSVDGLRRHTGTQHRAWQRHARRARRRPAAVLARVDG